MTSVGGSSQGNSSGRTTTTYSFCTLLEQKACPSLLQIGGFLDGGQLVEAQDQRLFEGLDVVTRQFRVRMAPDADVRVTARDAFRVDLPTFRARETSVAFVSKFVQDVVFVVVIRIRRRSHRLLGVPVRIEGTRSHVVFDVISVLHVVRVSNPLSSSSPTSPWFFL